MSTRHPVIVFPAPAGINRTSGCRRSAWSRVPRASGDKPFQHLRGGVRMMCSPRQRG
ncbi:hypothetical protein HDN32_001822 [Escherichia coli]|nr:hypothetical protein [Escherichia coli]EFM1582539.1 hypothetical protein [Escherichia coli]EFM3822422.1 hypothetical protein [Escherichia coli]HAW3762857.1 hypothetical protein [Escherichia coli]